MKMKRFKTDYRLWFWVSITLFVVPWCLPIWDVKGRSTPPGICFWILFSSPSHILEALGIIAIFTLLFGIPAFALGWIVQAILAVVWQRRRHQ